MLSRRHSRWDKADPVERHDDIPADAALNVHHRFGCEQVFAAVDMALEQCALLGKFPAVGEEKPGTRHRCR